MCLTISALMSAGHPLSKVRPAIFLLHGFLTMGRNSSSYWRQAGCAGPPGYFSGRDGCFLMNGMDVATAVVLNYCSLDRSELMLIWGWSMNC
jgi:hypothetical protein